MPKLYDDLADWYPLLTAPEEYEEEAAWYVARLRQHAERDVCSVLELGAGAGANASHMKRAFEMTLVDRSEPMLRLSRSLNPELEHHCGDMRTFRCSRQFDAVFVHDAASYLTSAEEVQQVAETAAAHLAPGGVAMFCPDDVRENWRPETDSGGYDGVDGRGLRYVSWSWAADEGDTAITDFAYLLKSADGTVRVEHDRHVVGRLPRRVWLEALDAVGAEDAGVGIGAQSGGAGSL